MSDPTKSVNNIHGMKEGGGYRARAGMALTQKRKKEEETEGLISTKVPRKTSQALDLEKMQRNPGNGMASYRDTAFSIDKILSPSSKDADLASANPTRAAEITKNSGRSLPFLDDKKMTKKSEAKQIADHAEVENVANPMPVDKWYNTLLWQQHQQQYQQHLAAASAFYHTQHFQHPLPNAALPQQTQPPCEPVPLPVGPPSGIPPAFCPVMPGRVHPYNCQCAEQMSEQPYFLLTPAGYSIPSPFQPDHQYSSLRYCRRRKARTVFTEYQIRGLEARFFHQQYLSTHERVELANVLFLTEGQVKTWFQNRRMKQKKLSRDSEHHFLDDDDDDDANHELDFDDEADFNNDLDDEGSTKTLHTKN